jgi:hypothetical protein
VINVIFSSFLYAFDTISYESEKVRLLSFSALLVRSNHSTRNFLINRNGYSNGENSFKSSCSNCFLETFMISKLSLFYASINLFPCCNRMIQN